VLAGEAEGRRSDDEATVFDSTGLAIQDLAIALAAMEHANEIDLPMFDLKTWLPRGMVRAPLRV
jgi:ornithine cyclodeaminase/alanine dehydrogenase-like protein (mu-crystallin family)